MATTGATRAETGLAGRSIHAPRGKTLGGSSAVNAAVAMRSRPEDFAKWRALGIEGWQWPELLEAFKAIENTPDGDDAFRGRAGSTHQPEAASSTASRAATSEAVGVCAMKRS